jgi:hypothetical protein
MYINIFLLIKELSIQPYRYCRMGPYETGGRTYPATVTEARTNLTAMSPDTRYYSADPAAGSPAAGGAVHHLEQVYHRPADPLQAPPSSCGTSITRALQRITASTNTHGAHPGIPTVSSMIHVILLAYAINIFFKYFIVFFFHIIHVNMNNIVLS